MVNQKTPFMMMKRKKVALLFNLDFSFSMKGYRWNSLIRNALNFVDKLTPGDLVTSILFNNEIKSLNRIYQEQQIFECYNFLIKAMGTSKRFAPANEENYLPIIYEPELKRNAGKEYQNKFKNSQSKYKNNLPAISYESNSTNSFRSKTPNNQLKIKNSPAPKESTPKPNLRRRNLLPSNTPKPQNKDPLPKLKSEQSTKSNSDNSRSYIRSKSSNNQSRTWRRKIPDINKNKNKYRRNLTCANESSNSASRFKKNQRTYSGKKMVSRPITPISSSKSSNAIISKSSNNISYGNSDHNNQKSYCSKSSCCTLL